MLKVGLTGGIAVGKSYILDVFRELGCEGIDADAIVHKLMEPNAPAYLEIVEHFGKEILNDSDLIDRAKLGAIVFADETQRTKLNSIIHPKVFEYQDSWFAEVEQRNPNAIIIVDAALMIESGSYKRFDKIIVAYCHPELQLDRLMKRNNLTRDAAIARIASQMPSSEKLKYADLSIDTSDGMEDTRNRVFDIYKILTQRR